MPAGVMRSGLEVLLHAVHQVVGPGTVAQLPTGFVNLESVVHSYAPHLQWITPDLYQNTSQTNSFAMQLDC